MELDGPFQFSAAWFRSAAGHSLRHINLYGDAKRHGFATLMLLVSLIAGFQYAYVQYLDQHSAYYMAIDAAGDGLAVNVSCSAPSCYFYQAEQCEPARQLSAGELMHIGADDCRWTVRVVSNSSWEAKRTAISLVTAGENGTLGYAYFAAVEQEVLKFASLSKTIDETYTPPLETWSVDIRSVDGYYKPCTPYADKAALVCGAFDIAFDDKVYKITVNNQVGFVVVTSTGMFSGVVFRLLWRLAMLNFDAGSAMQSWFTQHLD